MCVLLDPGTCREGDRRLANGTFDQRGRVELCINGLWGTVCDDEWDDTDALSFCADLGFPGTSKQGKKIKYLVASIAMLLHYI